MRARRSTIHVPQRARRAVVARRRDDLAKLVIEIPEDVAASMNLPEAERGDRVRQEMAVRLYAKGILNLGPSRRLSGLTRWQFQELLAKEGVLRAFDVDDLQDDLSAIQGLK